jgi:hypothetical protein
MPRRRVVGLVLALGLVGGSVGIAAAVTSDNGPFTGCLAAKTTSGSPAVKGQLYNLAKSTTTPLAPCVKGDAQIAISNAQGAQGIQGIQGIQGPQGIQGIEGPQGDPAALVPSSKIFAANDQSVDPNHTFAFGETINVTSIMMGDIGAGLRELAGGQHAVALFGSVPGVAEPVFLWEGPRTAQLSFVSALPLTAITAYCVVGQGGCNISITAVGY